MHYVTVTDGLEEEIGPLQEDCLLAAVKQVYPLAQWAFQGPYPIYIGPIGTSGSAHRLVTYIRNQGFSADVRNVLEGQVVPPFGIITTPRQDQAECSRTFDAYLYGRGALLEKFEATISVQLDRLQRSDSVGAPGMLQQLLLAYQTLREMQREEKGETPCPQS